MSTTRITHPPVVGELKAIFEALPDEELLSNLRGPKRRGRPGYNPRILWHCYIAYYCLGLPSISDLIRMLYDNSHIATACGINSIAEIPHKSTFSRFNRKLSRPAFTLLMKNIMRTFMRLMYAKLPDF